MVSTYRKKYNYNNILREFSKKFIIKNKIKNFDKTHYLFKLCRYVIGKRINSNILKKTAKSNQRKPGGGCHSRPWIKNTKISSSSEEYQLKTEIGQKIAAPAGISLVTELVGGFFNFIYYFSYYLHSLHKSWVFIKFVILLRSLRVKFNDFNQSNCKS